MNSEVISLVLNGAILAVSFLFWDRAKKMEQQSEKTLVEVNRLMDRINREGEPLKNQAIVMQALHEDWQHQQDIIDRIELNRKREDSK